MVIFKEAETLSRSLLTERNTGKKIGFVPTMGALHAGHLSLVRASKKDNDLTVCSIFVNPTQFNNPDDLKHYPVTIEKDIEALLKADCDFLFLPPVSQIYPDDHLKKHYDLGQIETVLEGKYRPGHFQGVCEVVDRLLDIVQPEELYLGQKDFQQCMVLKKLISLTGREDKIRLNIIPTMREEDGLAMSSRNMRLNEEQRIRATSIYKALQFIRNNYNKTDFNSLKQDAAAQLEKEGFQVDYVEIANAEDLGTAQDHSQQLVALIAASTGGIRLIDNMLLDK
jgi:pantoate--beta-alanine ligase